SPTVLCAKPLAEAMKYLTKIVLPCPILTGERSRLRGLRSLVVRGGHPGQQLSRCAAVLVPMRAITYRLIVVLSCCVASGAATAGTASAALIWSAPQAIDTGGGPALSPLACPSANACVALDSAGRAVSYDPASPGSATRIT